ncbi:MAG: YHS domain-containing protein [Planctomycetia bacterium]|nr:YHS domain-containing protein [Planctomycetia bacterium]
MNRFAAFALVSALLAALAVTLPAEDAAPPKDAGRDDMTVDPVCQMNIHKSTAPFFEDFQGQRFFFCNQNCFNLFKENRSKYAGAVQYMRSNSWSARYVSRPAKVYAGQDMKFFIVVEKATSEAKGRATKLEATECELIAELPGGRTTSSNPKLTFKPMKEEGTFGADCRFAAPGRLRLKVKVTFEDGEYDGVEFKLPVVSGEADDTGHEFEGRRVDMIIQHETMRKTGKYWTKTWRALEAGKADDARKYFGMVKGYQSIIKEMFPHVHEDDIEEFKKLDAGYAAALAEMEGVMKGQDIEKMKEAWVNMDALQCTECHMKFRWSTFSDVERYPVRNGK